METDVQPDRLRQPLDIVDTDIALAALDRADEGAMHAGPISEFFLGHSTSPPLLPEIGGEYHAERLLPGHGSAALPL